MRNADTVETIFYVEVQPERSEYTRESDGQYRVVGAKAVRLRQNRPIGHQGIVTQIRLRMPVGIFDSVMPRVVIDVPEGMASQPEIEAELIAPPEEEQ